MHACGIKFVGINVRGTCLISEKHESLYLRNIPAIRYLFGTHNYDLEKQFHLQCPFFALFWLTVFFLQLLSTCPRPTCQ